MTQPLTPTSDGRAALEPAQAVADAVTACEGVQSLSGGVFGEVATYLPGARVSGVRLEADVVEVHVVVRWGVTASTVAGQIRAAVVPLAQDRRIDVYVDDVAVPTEGALRQ